MPAIQDLLYSQAFVISGKHVVIQLEATMGAMAHVPSSTRVDSRTDWKQLYMAALFEDDSARISQRITEAEIALEAAQLGENGHEAREQQAMENATYFLRLLRKIESKANSSYESSSRMACSPCPQEEWV